NSNAVSAAELARDGRAQCHTCGGGLSAHRRSACRDSMGLLPRRCEVAGIQYEALLGSARNDNPVRMGTARLWPLNGGGGNISLQEAMGREAGSVELAAMAASACEGRGGVAGSRIVLEMYAAACANF